MFALPVSSDDAAHLKIRLYREQLFVHEVVDSNGNVLSVSVSFSLTGNEESW